MQIQPGSVTWHNSDKHKTKTWSNCLLRTRNLIKARIAQCGFATGLIFLGSILERGKKNPAFIQKKNQFLKATLGNRGMTAKAGSHTDSSLTRFPFLPNPRSSLLQHGRLVIVDIPDGQHQGHESKQQWGPHISLPWSLESLEPWKQEPWQNTIAILCTGRIRLVARTNDIGCLWAEDCWQTFRRFSKFKKNKQRLCQLELPRFKHCGYNGFTSDENDQDLNRDGSPASGVRSPLAAAYLKICS